MSSKIITKEENKESLNYIFYHNENLNLKNINEELIKNIELYEKENAELKKIIEQLNKELNYKDKYLEECLKIISELKNNYYIKNNNKKEEENKKNEEVYKATVVSEFSYKMVDYKEKSYKIQLWDLAGMDQNICITKIFSKDSHGCIVVSDITNEKTLTECVKWKKRANEMDDDYEYFDGKIKNINESEEKKEGKNYDVIN